MIFQFNVYSSLLLIPLIQSVLFSALLFTKKSDKYRVASRMLACILLLLGIKVAYWMLGFAGWYDTRNLLTTFMFYFPFSITILLGPLLYFYFLSITHTDFKFKKSDSRHCYLPLMWLTLILTKFIVDRILYYPFPHTSHYQYGTKGPFAELDKSFVFELIAYSSFLYYLLLTLKAYRSYRHYVQQHFSLLDNISFIWLRNITYAIATGVVIMFMYKLLNLIKPLSYKTDWYSYIILGILIYYVSIKGYQVEYMPRPQLQFEPEIKAEDKGVVAQKISPEAMEAWKVKINDLLNMHQPYLKTDFTLAQLAKLARTNNTVVSNVINEGFGMNFNDYINQYRVHAVTKCLVQSGYLRKNLLGIALDCGFNSKATFNRAFKKHTAKTPKEYIEGLNKAEASDKIVQMDIK